MSTYPRTSTNRTLYRSRRGWIFGVCQGLATYAEISVVWIRVAAFGALMLTGFWPVFVTYIVAAIFLKPAPIVEFRDEEDYSFYHDYVSDRKMALSRLMKRCKALDKRARRMENVVTDREYDWNRRFESGS
jgi:phage shock protein C